MANYKVSQTSARFQIAPSQIPPTKRSLFAGASLAFVLSLLAHTVLRYRLGNPPFHDSITGEQHSGGYGDFGAQYLPFHARLRDQLLGGDLSGLFFSWDASVGAPTIADYSTYLAGPFPALVAFVPQERVYVAIVIGTLLKLALAAALMNLLIRTINPGIPIFVSLILAVAYSMSAWVTDLAYFTPQWLDSLYGIPLLSLAALGLRRAQAGNRRWVGAVLAVALIWWANYYSAYMASMFSGIFFFLYQLAVGDRLKTIAKNTASFALAGIAGIALTSVFLVPTLYALSNGVGYESGRSFISPWEDIIIRLLPYSQGDAVSPNLYVGVFALIVAPTFLFAKHLTARFKIVWFIGSLFFVASLRLPALINFWNAFQAPHGTVYRWVFVITAWVVILAAVSWPSRKVPQPVQWLGGSQVLLAVVAGSALIYVAQSFEPTTKFIYWAPDLASKLVGLALGLIVVGWMLAKWNNAASKWLTRGLIFVLCVIAVAENIYSSTFTRIYAKNNLAEIPISYTVEKERLAKMAELSENLWPRYRTSESAVPLAAPRYSRFNASSRYLYAGTDYYTSTMQAQTTRPLIELGYRERSSGRHSMAPQDEVLFAILSATKKESAVEPLQMVRAVGASQPAEGAPPIFANREILAGSTGLYSFPKKEIYDSSHSAISAHSKLVHGENYRIDFSCPIGQEVFLLNRDMLALASTTGLEEPEIHVEHGIGQAQEATSSVNFSILEDSDIRISDLIIGCVDHTQLIAPSLRATPSELEITRESIRGEFDHPAGRIVVSTPAIDGWRCQAGETTVAIDPLVGFLSFDMGNETRFSCNYTPPGFKAGLAISVITLAGLFLMLFFPMARGSQRGTKPLAGDD